jgi:hypothetical protein
MSDVIDETPITQTESTTSTTPKTVEPITSTAPKSTSEISLWAHETPFLNTTQVEMTDLQDDTDLVVFKFADIPSKIREAEQYYDKCNYDASTAILVKCMQLYDEEYGDKWFHKPLEEDRPLLELPNIDPLLNFARLVKEYSLNMVLLAKYNDSLSSKEAPMAENDQDEDVEDEIDGDSDGDFEEGGFDDQAEEDNDEEEEENKETYFNYATENLQLAYQILGRYIIERSHAPSGPDAQDPEKEIFSTRVVKDEKAPNGETSFKYALGNPSRREIPASDLLPFLWRQEPGVSIRDIEICQVYLGDVYDSLADIHIEEEQWSDAAHYLELSLRLRRRTEHSYGRGLASIHTKYAAYYTLRHQYEFSNQHLLLAASVFAHRALDKIEWLYDNLDKYYKLEEKCPREKFIPGLKKSHSALDADVLMKQEDITMLRKFLTEELIPTITNRVFSGEITTKEVKEAVNNAIDYFQIIDSIMDLHADNMIDIEEGKNQQGNTVADQSTRLEETERVKQMVNEVWRTDSIMNGTSAEDVEGALGFKKITKTGDLKSTLAANINPFELSIEEVGFGPSVGKDDEAVSLLPVKSRKAAVDSTAFVPVVKRKAKGPAPGEDNVAKKPRLE